MYDVEELDAFVFHFSDGGELDSHKLVRKRYPEPCHLTCGKHRVLIRIGKDDGDIKIVTALYTSGKHSHRVVRLMGLRLETSTGKIMEVVAGNRGCCNMKQESHIPEGHQLRCINIEPLRDDYNMKKQRMFQVDTVPKKNGDSAFPSLVSLAKDAEEARLKDAAKDVERTAQNNMDSLQSKKEQSMNDIVKSARTLVQTSPEAAEVRRLQAELEAAKCSLREQSMQTYTQMMEHIKQTEMIHTQDRISLKAQWKSDRWDVLNEHKAFVDGVVARGDDCMINTTTHSLCHSPDCRRIYQPQCLHEHDKCSVKECRTNMITCGCSIRLCTRCSMYMCHQHITIHENYCKEEEDKLQKKKYKHSGDFKFYKEQYTEPRLSLTVSK